MERDFRYLREKHTDEGAREVFEKVCTQLFQAQFGGDAHRIRVCQGDGGIDILVGDFSKEVDIYQCKYFIDGVGESQQQQIRESYDKAKSSPDYKIKSWYLCIPCQLNIKEFSWWSSWKNKKENLDQIPMSLYEGSYLIGQFKKYELYNEIFDEDIRQSLEQILLYLNEEKQRIFDEIIALPSGEDSVSYDGMVFVKKLECAQIRNINGCKNDFFNAEYAQQSILSKGDENESKVYKNLKIKIHSFWETQYRRYQHETDGNDLLTRIYERIEDADTAALTAIPSINLLAKKGILHQLAEECSVGWLKDYQLKLEKYLLKECEEKNDD